MTLKKLCILRLSAIGDVTHVLPVVAALRAGEPELAITWIIGKHERQLVAGLSGVEFIVYDKAAGVSGYRNLRRSLDGRRFDALLHMQVSLRANLVSTAINAAARIGFDAARSRELHGLFVNTRISPGGQQHVLDGLLSFVEPLGLNPGPPRWELPLSDQDWSFARRHVDKRRPTLVLCPVSSHRLRNWSPRRYAAVADYAAGRHDFQVILTGAPGSYERRFGDRIVSHMAHRPTDLIGRDTLKQLAALLGSADLVLAPDTGPAHIANAMDTAVIGLYAASNPNRSGPYNSLKWCVNRYPEAAAKFKRRPPEALRWGARIEHPGVMDLIEVDDVTERLDAWVAETSITTP